MKKLIILCSPLVLTALLLSGCAKSSSVQTPIIPIEPVCPSSASNSLGVICYAGELKASIEDKLPHPERFAGSSCSLKLHLERDGTLTDVSVIKGDKAICDALVTAVKSADLPKPQNDEVYQVFKNASLDFRR